MDPTIPIRLCEVDSLYFSTKLTQWDSPLCWGGSQSAQVLQPSARAPSDVPPPPPLSLTISSFLHTAKGACLYSTPSGTLLMKKNLFWWFATAFRVWQNSVNKALCFAQEMEVAWEMGKSAHCSQRYLLLLLYTRGSICCFSRAYIKYRQI